MSDFKKSSLRETLDAWGDRIAQGIGNKIKRRYAIRPEAITSQPRPEAIGGECQSIQYSDTMICKCGLQYDVNEPIPPMCPETGQPARASGGPARR